jgi:hypothetical protein
MTAPVEDVTPPRPDLDGSGPAEQGWKTDKRGKKYIPRPTPPGSTHGKGAIYREGTETTEEALARDRAKQEERPRRDKQAKPKMPPASRKVESRELEESLAAALKAPGAIAMTLSPDDWLPEHFNVAGPHLARHVVLASEHNPWLRRRLEEAAQGEDAMWAVISIIGVGGALFAYAVPPIVYLFNFPVPENARKRWGMPPRGPAPPYSTHPQPTPPPAFDPYAPGPQPETPEPAPFAA